jgi:hypothetical protein
MQFEGCEGSLLEAIVLAWIVLWLACSVIFGLLVGQMAALGSGRPEKQPEPAPAIPDLWAVWGLA